MNTSTRKRLLPSLPSMMYSLSVILCRPKYSENIGSVARACANMGCENLILAAPYTYDPMLALPLATNRGKKVLDQLQIKPDLDSALAPFQKVYATSARVAGSGKDYILAEEAAALVNSNLQAGLNTALVFGPEDKGLNNKELDLCQRMITIPAADQACTFNLSQAVLLILYEIFKQSCTSSGQAGNRSVNKTLTHKELEILFAQSKKALLDIGFLPENNPDHFLKPFKRLVRRINLRHSEFRLLMGIFRQISWLKERK